MTMMSTQFPAPCTTFAKFNGINRGKAKSDHGKDGMDAQGNDDKDHMSASLGGCFNDDGLIGEMKVDGTHWTLDWTP